MLLKEPYITFDASKFYIGSTLPFDVFCNDQAGKRLLFSRGINFSSIEKNILAKNKIDFVYISALDKAQLENYVSGKKTISGSRKSVLDDPFEFQKISIKKNMFYQVDKGSLVPGTKINFSLFAFDKLSFVNIVQADEKKSAIIAEAMQGIQGDIVIKKSAMPLYTDYLNSVQKMNKLIVPRETAKTIIKGMLDDPRDGTKISELFSIISTMIDCIKENGDAVYAMLSIKNNDLCTYTHSVNTAVLSIGLGVAIGMDRDEIQKLGVGAILHDIGKSKISHEILNKQGRLSCAEFSVFQAHVFEGEKILHAHGEIPPESLIAVIQHHEKLNGKGYPWKLSGNDIKLFGRITAIADCYDAMVTPRPFRPAQSPFDALSTIAKETGNYDPELLKVFIKMLAKIR